MLCFVIKSTLITKAHQLLQHIVCQSVKYVEKVPFHKSGHKYYSQITYSNVSKVCIVIRQNMKGQYWHWLCPTASFYVEEKTFK